MRRLITIQQRSENGMKFRVQVWKRVWKMEYFGLKLGQDLGNRKAHPYQEFRGVPPRDHNAVNFRSRAVL